MTQVPLLNTKEKIATPLSGTTVYVDYSKEKKTLEVAFYPQKIYHYYQVDEDLWENYKAAIAAGESSGQFVNFKVKPLYNYSQVR
ncbi:KTSC domain-containing protein [Desertivirga brevis]|uniref:KTSC domain-containing protein n=1 Tax=Desertivirga brevis TaxID=2810310 RepID=UPI001A962D85|nr:KTSC domain-containing protein [Pedobacter sp. SYSU D00873]